MRYRRPAAGVDDDFPPLDLARAARLQLHDDALSVPESGFAEDQLDIGGLLERLLNVMAEALDHAALALVHPTHVHLHGAGVDTVVFRAPSEISDAGARHQGLGRRAADVDAGAADMLALDDRGLPACAPERDGKRLAGLARADYDGVVGGVVHLAPSGNGGIHLTRTRRFGQV